MEEEGRHQEKRLMGTVASYNRTSGRGCIHAAGRKDIVVDIRDVKRQEALEPRDEVSFQLEYFIFRNNCLVSSANGKPHAKEVVVSQRSRSKSPGGLLASVRSPERGCARRPDERERPTSGTVRPERWDSSPPREAAGQKRASQSAEEADA